MSVTALVINWNHLEATRRCLASLTIPYLLIDNGSTDGSAEALAAEVPGLLRLDANYGFAGGLNRALPHVTTPYVLLLNNDAELAPDTVRLLVEALDANPDAGAAAPTITDDHGLWYAGGSLNRLTGTVKHHHTPPDGRVHRVSYASACCLLVRRELLVGGLPEGYFLYFEDAELCDRLTQAGHTLLWVSAATCHHAGGASTGSETAKAPALDYYDVRNGLIFARRRLNPITPLLYLFVVRLPRKLIRLILKPQPGSLQATWRGLVDGLSGVSGAMPGKRV